MSNLNAERGPIHVHVGGTVVVVGEGVKTGEKMTCIDTGKMILSFPFGALC